MEETITIKEKSGKRPKYRSYISELKDELRKVTWTTKKELVSKTKIVLGATVAFGMGIYVIDLIVKGSFDSLQVLVQRIIG